MEHLSILGLDLEQLWHLVVQTFAAYMAIRHGVSHGSNGKGER